MTTNLPQTSREQWMARQTELLRQLAAEVMESLSEFEHASSCPMGEMHGQVCDPFKEEIKDLHTLIDRYKELSS